MKMNKCQQKFEKWAKNHDYRLQTLGISGAYRYKDTFNAWIAWCAAWEAAQKCEWGDIRTVRIDEDSVITDPRIKNVDK